MPVKCIESRVTAPSMFLYITGKWGFKHIQDRGHRVIEVSISDPTRQPVGSKNIVAVEIGTQVRQLIILYKPGVQISGLKAMTITCAADFDCLWTYFNKHHKTLVNDLKPLTITSMTTLNKHGATCIWKRINVGKKGGNQIQKLMLWSVDGKNSADIELPKQKKHAGKMFVDKCDLEKYTVQAAACSKLLSKTKGR